ncbi:ATP-binding protein [Nonomuraea sp. NN258]|uniref:ATP-binding protein n=1 Tax=Nonomuraea antri TaxID=2730852 RepID=UPI001569C318|nr:ATP-binding protein [Nonomuraea antri]NRQ32427.1 ATP-binding protein [Nonomuraea antri]
MDFELRCPINPDLGHIRDLVRIHATHCGLSGDRAEDLALAVNEAVTNVLDHGGQAGLVTVRGHEHGVTVEILDVGGRLTAGHLLAAQLDPAGHHGFGLWVIQGLCDDVGLTQTGMGSLLSLHMHPPSARVLPFARQSSRTAPDVGTAC